uniref:Uncharacterized protein n=1 Tax=Megaselia scalaris TaxID=36166 RepID=T1GL91_MEGSC
MTNFLPYRVCQEWTILYSNKHQELLLIVDSSFRDIMQMLKLGARYFIFVPQTEPIHSCVQMELFSLKKH